MTALSSELGTAAPTPRPLPADDPPPLGALVTFLVFALFLLNLVTKLFLPEWLLAGCLCPVELSLAGLWLGFGSLPVWFRGGVCVLTIAAWRFYTPNSTMSWLINEQSSRWLLTASAAVTLAVIAKWFGVHATNPIDSKTTPSSNPLHGQITLRQIFGWTTMVALAATFAHYQQLDFSRLSVDDVITSLSMAIPTAGMALVVLGPRRTADSLAFCLFAVPCAIALGFGVLYLVSMLRFGVELPIAFAAQVIVAGFLFAPFRLAGYRIVWRVRSASPAPAGNHQVDEQ